MTPKSNKDLTQTTPYTSICLLSVLLKVNDKLLSHIRPYINDHCIMHQHQLQFSKVNTTPKLYSSAVFSETAQVFHVARCQKIAYILPKNN